MIDAEFYDGWEIIKDLGEGGQGKVYLVRSPGDAANRRESIEKILNSTRAYSGISDASKTQQAFTTALAKFIEFERNPNLGALKQMSIKPGRDEQRALERFEKEIKALRENSNPALLRLLHENLNKRFMVTEYHPGGTLHRQRNLFKGNAFAGLAALRPLASAVAELHSKGIIHRDIKSKNVFIAADGRLVLGDFGIVFYVDDEGDRLTTTNERVGSRDCMPPWCNTGKRLEDVPCTCDLFALGKLLWVMISGQEFLPYWYHQRPEHNLEVLFPEDPNMKQINSLLDQCVVEQEQDGVASAKQLLTAIDITLRNMNRGVNAPNLNAPWPCRICGIGQYQGASQIALRRSPEQDQAETILALSNLFDEKGRYIVRNFVCQNCGHMEMFVFPQGKPPKGWLP